MKIDKNYLASIAGKTVEFTDAISNWESYAESGMRAIIVKWQFDEHHEAVHKLWFNFEPFEEENHKRQNANYYDENGNACLTAVEAGYYNKVDDYYIDTDTDQLPFKFLD